MEVELMAQPGPPCMGGGACQLYVKRSPGRSGLMPAGVVTVTSTVPEPAGE